MSFIASLAAVIGEGALALSVGSTAAGIIGGVGAGALTGTALSAGTAALTGGDVGQAAEMGAITGGLTGGLTSGIGLLGSAPETALGAAPGELFGGGSAGVGATSAAEAAPSILAPTSAPGAAPSILAPSSAAEVSGPMSLTPTAAAEVSGPMSLTPSAQVASAAPAMSPVEGLPKGIQNAANWVNRNQALTQGIGSLGAGAVLGPMMQGNNIPKPKQYKSPFTYDPNNFTPVTTDPNDYMYHPSYAEGGLTYAGGGGIGSMIKDVAGPGVLDAVDWMAINSPIGAMAGWENPEDVWLIGDAYKKGSTNNPNDPNAQQQTQPQPIRTYAGGGIASLGSYSDGGQLLKGPGDGVSDGIPASINGRQPARLADGEFVVPARIVSELGNGSTEAGAKRLYDMVHKVNTERAKTTKKGAFAKNTNAYKHLPL